MLSARVSLRVAALAVLVCSGARWAVGQSGAATRRGAVPEYEVKAAFLLNFVKFVDWPPVEPANRETPFDICIVGDDPFGSALDRQVEGETVNDRPIVIHRVRKWEEACRVMFVPEGERNVSAILEEVRPGVLTVGESPDFLRNGGMINFVLDDRRVRFDVNLPAAEHGLVEISSRLLSVARVVQK